MANDAQQAGLSLASMALAAAVLAKLGEAGVFDQDDAKQVIGRAKAMLAGVKAASPEALSAAKLGLAYFEELVLVYFEKNTSGRPQ